MAKHWRRLPGLNYIRVFECSARHLNFVHAAGELNITPGAVSQQVRLLEQELGIALFDRQPRGVKLTTAGEHLFEAATQALDSLKMAIATIPKANASVRVSVSPTLAVRWLVPRLKSFYDLYPETEVSIDVSSSCMKVSNVPCDVAIVYAPNKKHDPQARLVFRDDALAVCSPRLANRLDANPALLKQCKLLCWSVQDNWPTWFKVKGLPFEDDLLKVQFSHLMLAIAAAEVGDGIALTSSAFVESELQSGRLVAVFGAPVQMAHSYYVTIDAQARASAAARSFVDWIGEVAQEADLPVEALA